MLMYFFVRRVSAGALLAMLAVPACALDVLTLELDRAKIVELPAGTNTLVIGNPGVADATILRRQNRIVLTARGFGETNMIALDTNGIALAEIMVRVKSPPPSLIVQRGLERETWSCTERCEPAVNPGDSSRHTGEAVKQIGQHSGFARPATSGGGK